MAVPRNFRKSGDAPFINFDYRDVATGRGMILFYGCGTGDSVSIKRVLTESVSVANPYFSRSAALTSFDFDVQIERTLIFEGDALINCTYGTSGGGSAATVVFIDFDLIHYDGTTETIIASVRTETSSASVDREKVSSLKLPIPRTRFNKGDTIRLTAEVNGGSGTQQATIWHDPQTVDQELKIWLPAIIQT